MLERLKVQVRRPHIEGINQHFLQEPDDWRVIDLSHADGVIVRTRIVGSFVEFKIVADDAFNGFRRRGGGSLDKTGKFVIFGDHPVHSHLGGKLDFFSCFLVGRVCSSHHQAVIALAQHHDAVGGANLGVKQTLGQALDVNRVQVQQGRGKRGRQRVSQVKRGHRT